MHHIKDFNFIFTSVYTPHIHTIRQTRDPENPTVSPLLVIKFVQRKQG